MKHKLGAIFDLDGTLLESMNVWLEIDRIFLGKRGLPFSEEYAQAIKGMNFQQAAEYTIERFMLKEQAEDIIAEWNQLAQEQYEKHIQLKPNTKAYLQSLKESGVKLAIATASHPHLCEAVLKNNGVYDWFDAFAFSEEVERSKEFPDIYLLAAERLGLTPCDCVVYEDIYIGVCSAKAGGFTVCGVFDEHSKKEQAIIEAKADMFFFGFPE